MKSSTYKYVYYDPDLSVVHTAIRRTKALMVTASELPWIASPCFKVDGKAKLIRRRFKTEREAALFVDKWFLEQGRKPVNILKHRL